MSSPGGSETEIEEDNKEAVKYVKTCLTAREGRSPHGGRDGDRVLWFLAAGGQRDGESDDQGTAGNTGAGPNRRAGRQAGRAPPAGHTARNMSRGVCAYMHLVRRGTIKGKNERAAVRDRKEKEGAREDIQGACMCVICAPGTG